MPDKPTGKPCVKSIITTAARLSGSTVVVVGSVALIALYLVVGVVIGFPEPYNLTANTVMSAISFVLLFVIQYTQNIDGRAGQIKLDEIILAIKKADNRAVKIEELEIDELDRLEEEIRDRKGSC